MKYTQFITFTAIALFLVTSSAHAQMVPVAKSFSTAGMSTSLESVTPIPVEAPDMTIKTLGDKDTPVQVILEIQPVTPVAPANPYQDAVIIPASITNTVATTPMITPESTSVFVSQSGSTLAQNGTITPSTTTQVVVETGGPSETGTPTSSSGGSSSNSSGSGKKSKIGGTLVTTPVQPVENSTYYYPTQVYEKKAFTVISEENMVDADEEVTQSKNRGAASVSGITGSVTLIQVLLIITVMLGMAIAARKYQARTRVVMRNDHMTHAA